MKLFSCDSARLRSSPCPFVPIVNFVSYRMNECHFFAPPYFITIQIFNLTKFWLNNMRVSKYRIFLLKQDYTSAARMPFFPRFCPQRTPLSRQHPHDNNRKRISPECSVLRQTKSTVMVFPWRVQPRRYIRGRTEKGVTPLVLPRF